MALPEASRSTIDSYSELQNKLAYQAGRINGRHGEVDWTPIRYLNKGFSQTTLAGFYRAAAVGLVTPFRDGMNLVAKEYVAAQSPDNPGVLVLSEFAGAASERDHPLFAGRCFPRERQDRRAGQVPGVGQVVVHEVLDGHQTDGRSIVWPRERPDLTGERADRPEEDDDVHQPAEVVDGDLAVCRRRAAARLQIVRDRVHLGDHLGKRDGGGL